MVFFATICALEVVLEIGIIDAILEGNSEHGLETQTVQKTWQERCLRLLRLDQSRTEVNRDDVIIKLIII